jgi:N-acyl-L-homoserine lactone synthetase
MTLIMFNPTQSQTLFESAGERFRLQLLTSETEREASFRLRYAAYRDILGREAARYSGVYRDAFDDLATTINIGAYDRGHLVGAMRLCLSRTWDDLSTLPCAAYYPALSEIKSAAQGALMEVSRLSIDPDITNTSYRTTLYATLVRAGFLAAEAADVTKILIAMRPAWVRFYQYMLGFDVIGEPSFYPPGDFKVWLLGGGIAQARLRQRSQNAFFRLTPDEVLSFRQQIAPLLARSEAAE